jgi:AraC-like DNA-binding protein
VAGDLQLTLELHPDDSGELWIRSPKHHGALVHTGGMGSVAIAQATRAGYWRERSYPVEVALQLLNHHRGRADVYLSMQRFRGRRRVAHLLSMGSLYADLDYYRLPELLGLDPRRVLDLALAALGRASMPPPTLAIYSGRGLYLLWLHSPIPRSALPRWTACQHELYEVLRPLGADRAALDAARVLRVVGTLHGETGVMVEALTSASEVQNFDQLADEILPLARAKLRDIRIQRALRATRTAQERPQAPPEGFTQATLWEARLTDLQKLRELRWFGQPMPDYRDRWMFVAGVGMSWLAVPPVLRRELYALAAEIGGWTEAQARSKLSAVMSRAHAAARGERVEWAGLECDPRYRLKNQTIIELLEITPEEERELKTIISDEERRRRDRERKNPEMTRREYETSAAKRRVQARRMAVDGLTRQQIADALGWSKRHVQRVLNDDTGG